MKNTMLLLVSLAVCCFMLMTGSASKSLAASRITSDVKITPQATLTADERKAISIAAGQTLHHINKARREIKKKDSKSALTNLEQALTLLKIIDNAVPELQVNATIKSGDLTYHNEDNEKRLLVPIFKEEDEFFDASSSRGKSGKRTVLKNPTGLPTFSAGVEETAIFFDARDAKSLLDEAISRLNSNDLEGADQDLASIQDDDFEFVDAEVDLPLVQARMNLMEASRLAAADRFKEAEAFLHRTVGALENYQAEASREMAKKTRALINSINEVSGKLEQDKAGAKQKISAFRKELSSLL